jgi:Cu/Ag efflux pump CusA
MAGAVRLSPVFICVHYRERVIFLSLQRHGVLPAAVSTGIGSQVQRPLATVVVGGMFLGPIILLVVVPAVQTLFLDRRRSAPETAPGDQPSSRP